MSSYLSIYIVPKRVSEEEKKNHIILSAYSRSTLMYQYFKEVVNPVFIGTEESKYTILNSENIAAVIEDFNNDIKAVTKKITEYEKYAHGNAEYVDAIIENKEYLEELQYWRDKTSFIQDMVEDLSIYSDIEEVCCNID